jgi:hypothetical protein
MLQKAKLLRSKPNFTRPRSPTICRNRLGDQEEATVQNWTIEAIEEEEDMPN